MISNIRERDLRGVDLNLLVTLLVLLRGKKRFQSRAMPVPGPTGRQQCAFARCAIPGPIWFAPKGHALTPRGLGLRSQLLPVLAEMQSVILQT